MFIYIIIFCMFRNLKCQLACVLFSKLGSQRADVMLCRLTIIEKTIVVHSYAQTYRSVVLVVIKIPFLNYR